MIGGTEHMKVQQRIGSFIVVNHLGSVMATHHGSYKSFGHVDSPH